MEYHIKIEAKRWFQKSYGNTYHSVKVWVNNELIGYIPFTYGYESAYLQTAHKLLMEKGYFPKTGEWLKSGMQKDYYDFVTLMREYPDHFNINVEDVNRKKDL